MAAATPQLTLYSRADCHLCEEMEAALSELAPRCAFTVDVVDVDCAPELVARYGRHVPVLVHAGNELCRHRLDAARVLAYLAADLPR